MITQPFDTGFYHGGSSASQQVPWQFDVGLNGRPYMLDDTHYTFTQGLQTIPLLRSQADTSNEPGEQSINPEELWPRTQRSWHHGAGQQFLDRDDSDRFRFYSSTGADVWTRNQLGVLNGTGRKNSVTDTNLIVLQAGAFTYLAHGSTLQHTNNVTSPLMAISWNDALIQAGETPQTIKSIVTDGYTVYAALGSNGIHTTTRGAVASSHFNALTATLLGYVKGRLMAANGNAIYNVTASGAAPSALFTHPNTDWSWVGFAEGAGYIYAAGYSGDKSLIYKTAVKSDGTALDVPVVAGELPDGEIVRTIQGYLGFIIVGTDLGFRLATTDGSGNLTFGALVNIGTPVYCFEPQDRFVWFGYSNIDSNRTGLGRMDLSVQTATNVPAYATDIFVGDDNSAVQGTVQSVCTGPNNIRLFAVSGVALYGEDPSTKVSRAWVDSGKIDYGIADDKVALRLALTHQPLPAGGSVTAYLDSDGKGFTFVGSSAVTGAVTPDAPFTVGNVAGKRFQVRLEIKGGDVKVERYDLRSYPAPARGRTIMVPVLLYETVLTATGEEYALDPKTEYAYLDGYVGLQRPISYQEGELTFDAFVEELSFQRRRATKNRDWWEGTAVLKLKVLGD